jgi:co-chaperonin GroES (HSP10)
MANMASKQTIVSANGQELVVALPKAKDVRPFGSKILVEVLKTNEIMGSTIHIDENATNDGTPQAYITKIGPGVPADCGFAVGQRIYWSGKGVAVDNPSCKNGRVNALLEINNIWAIIEE